MISLKSRILIFLTLLINLQCYWGDPPPTDTIVFGLSSEPKTLDPRFSTDANGQRIGKLIFSSLVQVGSDLEMTGDLAESWEYDNLTYRFKLKKGVRFHDGSPLTTQDLQFSFDEYRKSQSPFSAQFKVVKSLDVRYDVETGGTLSLHLEEFSASLLTDLASLRILPKAIVEQLGDDFNEKPIGTGPFTFLTKDLKNIFLKRNSEYFGQKSRTEKLQFKIIKDSNTRFQKMYKGKIDIIQSDVPFSKIRVFDKHEKFEVQVKPGLSTAYILLNLKNPVLKNEKVRHAISAAINRDELIRYTHEGFAEKAKSILTTANPFHNHDLVENTMSTEEVKAVFAELANQPIILKTSNTQEAVENGKVITHQLRKMGLNVKQQTYEWGTYYEDVRTGKFEMAIMKWVGIYNPDIYRISLHSDMTPPGRNRGYYSNPEFDQLVSKAAAEPDTSKRKELYHRAQEIVYKELPTIPLWYEKQVAIIHKRVKGYELPLNGDFNALMNVYKEDDGI